MFNLFQSINEINAAYARIHGLSPLPANVVPMPTRCPHCGHVYTGSVCNLCKRKPPEQ